MLYVDLTSTDAGHSRLGRYRISERREDGSLVLVPEELDARSRRDGRAPA
jgi:hypothetical protein